MLVGAFKESDMSIGFSEGRNVVVRKISRRQKSHRGLILGAAVASALAGMTSSSRAVDYSWVGTSGAPSFWDTATNWSPNTAFPGGSDGAIFGNGAADFTVNLNATS